MIEDELLQRPFTVWQASCVLIKYLMASEAWGLTQWVRQINRVKWLYRLMRQSVLVNWTKTYSRNTGETLLIFLKDA